MAVEEIKSEEVKGFNVMFYMSGLAQNCMKICTLQDKRHAALEQQNDWMR